jgi:ABC-type branched-subunit amino acid transport system ATPase component
MHGLLEAGCETEFCHILGIIADMKQTAGRVSDEQQRILQIPRALFRRALGE